MRKSLGRYPNGAQAVKVFGHIGAVAFSRTSDFEQGKFNRRRVLRRFGQVADHVTLSVRAAASRTLTRCCEEHLGMSPMKYLWLRRMNQARKSLRSDPSPASVTEIAMKFGFWHLGRFANEYIFLFGEAPRRVRFQLGPMLRRSVLMAACAY
jgi:AraC-like DNA-binding protein